VVKILKEKFFTGFKASGTGTYVQVFLNPGYYDRKECGHESRCYLTWQGNLYMTDTADILHADMIEAICEKLGIKEIEYNDLDIGVAMITENGKDLYISEIYAPQGFSDRKIEKYIRKYGRLYYDKNPESDIEFFAMSM
jgi:hypothetical protein